MSGPSLSGSSGAGWGWVLLAGLFEVGMTYALKMEQEAGWSLLPFIVCSVISFECLAKSLDSVPLGIAYAVWTGIGAVGTILVGVAVFGDPLSPLQFALLAVLIGAILGLKLPDK